MATKKLQIIGGALLQSDWEETDPTFAAFIKNKPELHPAALSGDYNQLKNLPIIDSEVIVDSANAVTGGAVYNELIKKANTENLPRSALSGRYSDLEGTPGQATEDALGLIKLYSDAGENEDGAMTQKAVMNAINNSLSKVQAITLSAGGWQEDGSQVLELSNITINSKIDIHADAHVIKSIIDGGFSIVIKNENGIATAYVVGGIPLLDLTLQLIITEVNKDNPQDIIWGNPLVATTPPAKEPTFSSFIASNTAPKNTFYLWVDTANSNLLKYHNGDQWVPISAAWG